MLAGSLLLLLFYLFFLVHGKNDQQYIELTVPAPAPPKLPCVDPVIKTKLGTYTYPLSQLQGKMMISKASLGGQFFLSVCADSTTGKPFCTNKDSVHPTAMAAYCPITQSALAIASAKSVTSRSYSSLNPKNPLDGLLLRVQPLNPVIRGGFEVQFICNPKITKAPLFKGLMKETPLGFNFTVTTSAVCPAFVPTPTGGGWSTIFLVVFFVCTFLYCGIGCVLNVRAGVDLMQACPHRSSWCNLPGLVKDGIVFFFGVICGSSGGGSGSDGNSSKSSSGRNSGKIGDSSSDSGGGNYSKMVDDVYETSEKGQPVPNYGSVTETTSTDGPVDSGNYKKPRAILTSSGRHNDRNDDFADTTFED
jgi:hypothetical protein